MGRGLLIIVTGLFVVYGIIQNSLNQRQKNISEFSVNYAEKTKAETIANSMADLAFAEINQNPQDSTAGSFSETDILDGQGSVSLERTRPYASEGNPFVIHKILTATGTFGEEEVQIEVTTIRRPFSRYSYFTNVEGDINFTDGDVLNGPVHTNGTFHLNGDAIFNGPVTSVGGCEGCDDHDPQFNGGSNFNADEINLPVEVPELAEEASNSGLRFNNDKIKVEFKADGTADITQYQQTGTVNGEPVYSDIGTFNHDLQDSDFNGIISSSGNIDVIGTLNGDVTLHSEQDIEIMGDIRYEHLVNPPVDPDPVNEDFLGIVSQGHTIVDKNAHHAEGSQDLDIHASIMAMKEVNKTKNKGSFYVEDYNQGYQRGYLNILGGLVQYKRGAVGTSGNTGYLKDYTYDERFLGRSPRGFPRSDVYDFVSWKVKYPNEMNKKMAPDKVFLRSIFN